MRIQLEILAISLRPGRGPLLNEFLHLPDWDEAFRNRHAKRGSEIAGRVRVYCDNLMPILRHQPCQQGHQGGLTDPALAGNRELHVE